MEPNIKVAILCLSWATTAAAMDSSTAKTEAQSRRVENGLGLIQHIVFIVLAPSPGQKGPPAA